MRAVAAENPNLTDGAVLSQVARFDAAEYARFVAAKRVEDQGILERLAEDPEARVRAAAAGKLRSQRVLARVAALAARDGQAGVGVPAVERLEDRAVLERLARLYSAGSVGEAAAERLAALK